jgi:transcriptional regulator with XRE-family HTH domain
MLLYYKPFSWRSFIKTQRKLNGLSQFDLADRSGVSLDFIRAVEQGKLSFRSDVMERLLNYFGFSMGPLPAQLNQDGEESPR